MSGEDNHGVPAPKVHELQVRRDQLRDTKIVEYDSRPLGPGEVRLRVDKFALTANNVSYAVSGDQIGYWKFFPAGGEAPEADSDSKTNEWGVIPVWGVGDVVESLCEEVPVSERLYGYLPIASQLILRPGLVKTRSLVDTLPHRVSLPLVYNRYSRMSADPPELRALEDERCLFFPLFITSFFLYDYLVDNQFFGAKQVVLGSASSKTALGLAHLLHHDEAVAQRVVGLTSEGNVPFVEALGTYDQVSTYDQIEALDSDTATAFVDMAGSLDITRRVHQLFADKLLESCQVGATHWESERGRVELPGAEPHFFFAPSQIQKREQEWGPGVALQRANEASVGIAKDALQQLSISHRHGSEEVQASLLDLLDNKVPPSCGLMMSMNAKRQ